MARCTTRRRKRRGLYAQLRVNGKGLLALAVFLAVWAGAALALGALAAEEGVAVPIVMYHGVLRDPDYQGKYVISPEEFESDLNYLESHGYTTLLMADLIAYTQGGGLPEKPVLLTFDDGYYNNYLYAFPIAKEHGCRFVISPIGVYADQYTREPVDNAYYAQATWPQLREMARSGLVEVQNHSYDLHGTQGRLGARRLPGETAEQYRELLARDLLLAQERIQEQVGVRPTTFVYPFGAVSDGAPEIVEGLGFSASLSCEEKVSRITRDPRSLYGLGRFLRESGESSESFFQDRMGLKP